MHENCDFNEKEEVFRSYPHLRTKTLEKFKEENNKNGLDWIGQRNSEKAIEKV